MKEKEIFRDCYNMLTANLENPNWPDISLTSNNLIHQKYGQDKYEQLLCAELVAVIVNHLDRKRERNAKQ